MLKAKKFTKGQYSVAIGLYPLNPVAFHLNNSYEGHWDIFNMNGSQVGRFETKADCLKALEECSENELIEMSEINR
jgi:hypothetical protein